MLKLNLADRLAQRIRAMIQEGQYRKGDRLPPIMQMARRFGVGHPSLREALKKLEAMGMVEIRHGSGVYVTRNHDVMVVATPDYAGTVTRKLLLDLIQARAPLEVLSAALAAKNADPLHLAEMRRLLEKASATENEVELNTVNMAFHREIALTSGNAVLVQLISVLQELFVDEQRLIIGIFGTRQLDHEDHLGILAAIEAHDERLASERMTNHLRGVTAAIRKWNATHATASGARSSGSRKSR